jgi:hypothetical protein
MGWIIGFSFWRQRFMQQLQRETVMRFGVILWVWRYKQSTSHNKSFDIKMALWPYDNSWNSVFDKIWQIMKWHIEMTHRLWSKRPCECDHSAARSPQTSGIGEEEELIDWWPDMTSWARWGMLKYAEAPILATRWLTSMAKENVSRKRKNSVMDPPQWRSAFRSIQIQHPDNPCAEGFESGQDLLCPDVLGSKPIQVV